MRINRSREHLADEVLVAYLDGEMSRARMRAVRAHLNLCWKCRSALAELETAAEVASHLLAERSKDEIDRSLHARERFLRWRAAFEAQQRFFFKCHLPQWVVAGGVFCIERRLHFGSASTA
jgi:anti-sigma factor RsiW